MKKIATTVALLATLTLAGCSTPVEGFVWKKDIVPEQAHAVSVGPVDAGYYTPACYRLEVDLPNGSTAATCVEQGVWEGIEVGQFYRSEK